MKLADALHSLDTRAQAKLGFIAAPVLGSIGLGGIPAWVLSRAIAALLCGGLVWGYLLKRDHATELRVGREYERKAAEQRKAHENELTERAEASARERDAIETAWKRTLKDMADRNRALDEALNKAQSKPTQSGTCYPKPVADVLRKKALDANKRYLK